MAAIEISLKVWIDKKRNRVLFAEAGKDFVDFLLQVFSLPIITVAGFLKAEDHTAGCLQSVYESIKKLSDTNFFQRGVSKDLVLKPKLVMSGATDSLLLPRVESYTFMSKFYQCRNCLYNGTFEITTGGDYCKKCRSSALFEVSVNVEDQFISANKDGGKFNFGKESVPYIVMDDLKMKPMSANTFVTLLNEYNLKDVGAIEEKVVALGMDECVKLLKAALQSKTALTDVFLPRPSETEEAESSKTIGSASEGPKETMASTNSQSCLPLVHCVKLLKAALQSKTALTDVFLPRSSETEEESSKTIGSASEGPNEGSSVFLPD